METKETKAKTTTSKKTSSKKTAAKKPAAKKTQKKKSASKKRVAKKKVDTNTIEGYLSVKKVPELRRIAEKLSVEGFKTLKKPELVAEIVATGFSLEMAKAFDDQAPKPNGSGGKAHAHDEEVQKLLAEGAEIDPGFTPSRSGDHVVTQEVEPRTHPSVESDQKLAKQRAAQKKKKTQKQLPNPASTDPEVAESAAPIEESEVETAASEEKKSDATGDRSEDVNRKDISDADMAALTEAMEKLEKQQKAMTALQVGGVVVGAALGYFIAHRMKLEPKKKLIVTAVSGGVLGGICIGIGAAKKKKIKLAKEQVSGLIAQGNHDRLKNNGSNDK